MTDSTTTPTVEHVVIDIPEETPKQKFFTLKKKLAITGAAVAVAMVAVFIVAQKTDESDSDETAEETLNTEVFELTTETAPEETAL